jgi:hypothetical protein
MCKATHREGFFRIDDLLDIPITDKAISVVIDEDLDTVRVGMKVLEEFGLIQRDEYEIYIPMMDDMVGKITEDGLRKREQRQRLKAKQEIRLIEAPEALENNGTLSHDCPENVPEIKIKNYSKRKINLISPSGASPEAPPLDNPLQTVEDTIGEQDEECIESNESRQETACMLLMGKYNKKDHECDQLLKLARQKELDLLGCLERLEWELGQKHQTVDSKTFCAILYNKLKEGSIKDELPWHAF